MESSRIVHSKHRLSWHQRERRLQRSFIWSIQPCGKWCTVGSMYRILLMHRRVSTHLRIKRVFHNLNTHRRRNTSRINGGSNWLLSQVQRISILSQLLHMCLQALNNTLMIMVGCLPLRLPASCQLLLSCPMIVLKLLIAIDFLT